MTNTGDFPRSNSTVKSIEGTIATDQMIKLVATISPKRVSNHISLNMIHRYKTNLDVCFTLEASLLVLGKSSG